jgi:hypothetical protein
MFCPSCGAETAFGLKYCKRCGGNLTDTTYLPAHVAGSPPSRFTGPAWAIGLATVAICLGGLGIVFVNAWDLVRPLYPGQTRAGDPTMVAMTMIIFGSATIFGIIGLLIRLFTRLMGVEPNPAQQAKTVTPAASGPPRAQLSAPPAPLSSVTEHTTRTFQHPAYEEVNARE